MKAEGDVQGKKGHQQKVREGWDRAVVEDEKEENNT